MDKIFQYISYMLPFMITALVIYIPIRVVILKRGKKSFNIKNEIFMTLFIGYVIGLLSITAFPKVILNGGIRLVLGPGSVTLTPFKTISSLFNESFINFAILFIGNIVMFMPIGFFIPLIWKKGPLLTCAFGFLFSLYIEVSQLFVVRNTDVDDLILNTLGVFFGYLLYVLIKHIIIYIRRNTRNNNKGEICDTY